MFTDMVGYTALTQRDEAVAMALLEEHRALVRPFFPKHGGREVKTIGDAFLVEFDSALEAVRCAYDMQQAMHELNQNRPADTKVQLRVGIHLGDIIHSQSDVYGDAVNVASRIEPLAAPGGICISEEVQRQVKNKAEFPIVSLGKKELKNVGEPIEVYKVGFPWERQETPSTGLDKKRLAVLPFTNLSSDAEEGYFADGVTEELITAISGVRQLTVIARTSVMGYKGTTKKVKEIGRELEAGTILEGSVRKAGNRVRITAQLIDATTEGHIWAQNYDRQLEDVFAIQSEIAEKVAGELKVRLVEDEKRVIVRKPTENTEAYTFYLRGRELMREMTEQAIRQAIAILERAVAMDPSFAKAYAAVALCHAELVTLFFEPYEQAMPKADIAVNKALQLDPELAEAHATLARIFFQEDDVLGCEREANRAVQLNPSLADAHFSLSSVYLLRGEKAEGLKASESCFRLDPALPRYAERLGQLYFYLGMEKEALEHWEKTAQSSPAGTYRAMAEYHLHRGDVEKAKELRSRAETLDPSHRWSTWMKGFIAGRTGDRAGALEVIQEIEKKWLGATNLNDIAFFYHSIGDLDSYFAYINRATDQHTLRYMYVMFCPLLERGRDDPRYSAVMEKLKQTFAKR